MNNSTIQLISVILPVYNEEDNILKLYDELLLVLASLTYDYELLWINDGSSDKSAEILDSIAKSNSKSKVINFRRNFGQTAAMSAGIKLAQGEIIIPMDTDLQNDPRDIPNLIAKINEGFDVVSGWRYNRQDKLFSRKIPSWFANYIIRLITGVKLHDYGCSLKAYRQEVIKGISLYGEMHRFIPAYAAWQGAKITEVIVNHRPRQAGLTKYGLSRTFKVVLDLIVIKFMANYMDRPIHFFGGLGFGAGFLGVVIALLALWFKVDLGVSLSRTPLPILAAMMVIVGVQFLGMGILAEILMRTYYKEQHKDPYIIKNQANF